MYLLFGIAIGCPKIVCVATDNIPNSTVGFDSKDNCVVSIPS